MAGQEPTGLQPHHVRAASKRMNITAEQYQARLDAGEKYCSMCREWHPIDAFEMDATMMDGRRRICLLEYRRAHRKTKCAVPKFCGITAGEIVGLRNYFRAARPTSNPERDVVAFLPKGSR